ncbi:MAG: hypothetical protein ACYC3I_27975 [Gemmataceae bacterium]
MKTGTVVQIQVPRERVTSIHGILFDLDPQLYQPGNPFFPPAQDPKAFFENISPVLDRHPLTRSAEVRATGTGLHAIVRISPPAMLASAAEQHHWDNIVRAVQATLPADVNAPGITALTRPIGSTNSKNGNVVELIRPGTHVNPEQVMEYLQRVVQAPFQEIVSVLLGGLRIEPCPVCRGDGTRLDVLDHMGMCYSSCGRVKLHQIYDCAYAHPAQTKKTAKDSAPKVEPKPSKQKGRTASRSRGANEKTKN